MSSNKHYPFSQEYQRNVLACMFSTTFLRHNRQVLDREYFSDITTAVVASEVLSYFDKYNKAPSKGALYEQLRKTLKGKRSPSLTDCRKLVIEAGGIKNLNPEDVSNSVREFSSAAAVVPILVEYQEAVEEGSVEKWEQELKAALQIRYPPPALVPYHEGILERFKSYTKGEIKADPIPLGIQGLDVRIGGGIDRQEQMILISLSGVGKSQVCVHAGATAVESGRRVDHYCCEMKKDKLLRRYDRRFTGKYEKDIAKAYKRLSKVMSEKGKGLRIAHFPEGVLTPGMIRSDFDRLGPPDLLIVDYPALMKRSGTSDMAFTRFSIELNYMEVRAIAMEYNCASLSPFQANRMAHETEQSEGDYITRKHSAEAYGVVRHADLFVSLNQTEEEREDNRARLWVDKNRDDRASICIPIEVDWSRSMVT